MEHPIFEDIEFNSTIINDSPLKRGSYDSCTFINCDLSTINISEFSFTECVFENCNLSNIKLINTSLKDITFTNCKLIGVDFSTCNPFLLELNFIKCQLDYSSFYQLKIKATSFQECSLKEVDFTETNLQESIFENSDLYGSIFDKTNLTKTDFRLSKNYQIDPENNIINKAKFSTSELAGLLAKYNIEID